MPFVPIEVPPGIVKTDSPYAATGRWIDCDHVRFVKGRPQKIGGIQKFDVTHTFAGVVRAARAWATYTGIQVLAFGTACRLYILREGSLSEKTPYRTDAASIALTNPFTVIEGSAVVTVTDTAHGIAASGVVVNFSGASALGGITINGDYSVTSVLDVNTFTITHSAPAVAVNDQYTKALLHMDGVDAATTFTDSNAGGSAHTWTAAGNAQIDTAAFKFSTASGLFDGTGDWITTPDHADFTLGAGDFTIDLWFRLAGGDGSLLGIAGQNDSGITAAASAWTLQRLANNKIRFQISNASAFTQIDSTNTFITAASFKHLAVVRNGNTIKLYVDGVQEGTGSFSATAKDSASVLGVGVTGATAANGFNGWIDEVRLSVGIARWTSAFTPPAVAYGANVGGGSVTASYTLNCGNVDPTYLVGWGIGTWGEGLGWGRDASLASAQISDPTNWSLDVYGEDLVINQRDNGIWIYDSSTNARPAQLTNAPTQVRYAFVTAERYIFALGCTRIDTVFDPMTVRWPDIDDNTDWTPTATNTSNERKLQGGTRLMAGTKLTQGVAAVWSDAGLFIFQFTGGTSVIYASRMVGENCGLIAPHAWATANGVAYWMSETNFHMYSGAVQPIPNVEDIRQWVLDNVSRTQRIKSYAFYNAVYDEVWFVFPGAGDTEPGVYVAVKLGDFSWIHGTLDRTAATFYTVNETRPIMFSTNGYIYVHEVTDDPNKDSAAFPFHLELAPADIQAGNKLVDIFGFVPDFQRQSGDLSLYLYGLDQPQDTQFMTDTVTVSEGDKLVDTRAAGRQFGMILSGTASGVDFRLGRWGLEISGAGTKRGSQA